MRSADQEILIQYRLGQAHTALQDARLMQSSGGSTMSIANRSYYAMFYAVLALLQTTGQVPSKHAGAISLFDREFVLKGVFPKELSRSLHLAFDARQRADYQEFHPVSADDAAGLLSAAECFVATLVLFLDKTKSQTL